MVLMADMLGASSTTRPESVQEVMDGLRTRQPIYAWIGVADQTGRIMTASGGLLKGQNVSSRPWFAAGLQGNFIGDPHDAVLLARHLAPGANGEPPRFLDVAAPLKDEQGAVRGVFGGHLYWDWVNEVVLSVVERRTTPINTEVLIANRQGQWLLSYNLREGSPPDLASVRADPHYLMATRDVAVRSAAQGPGWTIVVREDAANALEPVRAARRQMLAFTLAAAALFALLSWWVAGRVVRPIVQLASAVKRHAGESPGDQRERGIRAHHETNLLREVMDRLVHTDRLTNLLNRNEMLERLHETIERTARKGGYGFLLLVNLDNFSVLNNTRGHEVGDQLLIAVARRLRGVEGSGVLLARPGGDEFLVFMDDPGGSRADVLARAQTAARLVLAQFQQPFALEDGHYQCHVSVGVAVAGDGSVTVDAALKHAELAVLEAKKQGKNQAVVFDQRMEDALHERVQFEASLRAAIPSQLVVFYQPQIDAGARLMGAEVLVRWQHPEHGMVSPAEFIPLAEETGLIVPIGLWVLEAACRQLRRWEREPAMNHLVLAVNVSAKEFGHPGYVQEVRRVLAASGANPRRLKLELTESVFATDVDGVVRRMQELQALGISFALDDFGTGFSSLSYLKRMPLDQLKIDQSFVRDVTSDASDASIVRAVIALSEGLGLKVIAEGVETQAQRDLLTAYGCSHFQGYLFGRPLPVAEFEQAAARGYGG